MYCDDINNYEKEDYPELIPSLSLKEYLLSRPFTQRDGGSLNVDVIANYLDDYDIAMKAAELPIKRLKKILDTYLTDCYARFNKCYKEALETHDSKVHNDAVMQAATMGYVVEFLQEALEQKVQHPKHKKKVEKYNATLHKLHQESKDLHLPEELPKELIIFDVFFKEKENECLSYIEKRTGFELSSKDRTRRVLPEAKRTAGRLYEELCDNPDTVEDMMDGYRSKVITLATSIIGNNSRCKQQYDAAKNNIMFILNKHDELMGNTQP